MLHFTNSLSRKKERFTPREPGAVGLYVCGITIYDYCHIGHARTLIAFDVIYRHLLASGYRVNYVRNITDVDDKIIRRAGELGEPIDRLTARFIEALAADCAALGVLAPSTEPRATQSIEEMQALIARLIAKGHAYQGEGGGDVYFAVESFAAYGKLSRRALEDQRAGERIEIDPAKRHPLDFVLWKAAKPGEPQWSSPWGGGRPGWHIECSAMARSALGEQFDIHGGGGDLVFPHHENEIAQSEAAHGCAMANYWLHTGMLTLAGEKMSKSLGNFDTIRAVLERFDGEEIRLFSIGAHYRSPLAYGEEALRAARAGLTRLYGALRDVPPGAAVDDREGDWAARFVAAMDDDINTPVALAVLYELCAEINRCRDAGDSVRAAALASQLRSLGGRLGLLQREPQDYLRGGRSGDLAAEVIEQLIDERRRARESRDYARADALRDQLSAAGVVIEDRDGQTHWRRDR